MAEAIFRPASFSPISWASTLAVPSGMMPSGGTGPAAAINPFTTSLMVPSPPAAIRMSASAQRAFAGALCLDHRERGAGALQGPERPAQPHAVALAGNGIVDHLKPRRRICAIQVARDFTHSTVCHLFRVPPSRLSPFDRRQTRCD